MLHVPRLLRPEPLSSQRAYLLSMRAPSTGAGRQGQITVIVNKEDSKMVLAHMGSHGRMSSQKQLSQCLCLWVSSSCLLPFQETLQDLQVGLTQSPFKWLHLPWILECEILWLLFKSGVSISNRLLCFMKLGLLVLQRQIFWGLVFLVQDPQSGEPLLLVENISSCNFLMTCDLLTWGGSLDYTTTSPLLHNT